jgi:hypothetical protein
MMTSLKAAPGELIRKPSRARTIGIASAIWGVSIFLSRIMGLVREQIIGRTLGASREADLCFASFTLPFPHRRWLFLYHVGGRKSRTTGRPSPPRTARPSPARSARRPARGRSGGARRLRALAHARIIVRQLHAIDDPQCRNLGAPDALSRIAR